MQAHATVAIAPHGIELRCPSAGISEDRPFAPEDVTLLQTWASRYQELARADRPAAGLLQLGEEIFAWLNGPTQFLVRLLDTAQPPLLIEFAAGREDTPQARASLDAPWELLASDGQHWALRADAIYCPIRRIGKALTPPPPAPHRLSLVFMAAAPRGAGNLNYEAEEAAILTATKEVGLDLVVEESGTLDLLSACVAREQPDVIQISCHGTLEPEPGLLLEDEAGDRDFVQTTKLVSKLGAHHPRLLFLSACETAEADPVLDSLARSLTRSGTPAVLGWAAPVRDVEATLFAAGLHGRLTAGEDLAHALAYARFDLGESEHLPEPSDSGPRSHDWHLARLYLSSTGGGALATADGPRRLIASGRAVKTFLDTKGKQVPVAGEREFVGRRRETQTILREFRAPAEHRRAGVFVHGLGRQGKSSLAARVARRLEHTHEPIVIYRRYDGPAILAAFRDRLATPAVTEIVKRHLPQVEQNPANLLAALTELLEGPCDQQRKDASDRFVSRPVLVVVDDFEQALEETPTGPRHGPLPHFVEPIRVVIRAFNYAATDSRLLFTSRYQFTLPDGETDLADLLLDVPLHGMDKHESRKQVAAKLRVQEDERGKRRAKNLPALLAMIDRIIAAARGNPGLQDILFSLCLENPDACDRCLEQMEEYAKSGTLPAEDQARQFLENLAIGALLDLLTPAERELLHAMTLFELPAPAPVAGLLAQQGDTPAGDDGLARLIALGLCEVYEDLHHPAEPALAVNALVRPVCGALSEDDQRTLAALVSTPLLEHWGGQKGARQRKSVQDHELTRLALLARDARVLAATAADALRLLDQHFAYQQAAAWAVEIMAVLDAAKLPASVRLLRTAAERCQQVGDVATGATFLDRALALIEEADRRGQTTDTVQHAATLLTHARAIDEKGRPDEALGLLERAKAMLPSGREQAIVMGDIARLRADKGEVDAALQLLEEARAIFESLGDKRSRAGTLGEIARLRAGKGEVDDALQLHQEALGVYEALGDKRSRAVALGDIARLRADKGEVDAALRLHQENLAICDELGDKKGRAVTLGDIARLRANKGEVDAALQLHQERLAIFEALGDPDGIANTLWSIARIELEQQKLNEAAEHLAKSYDILLKLGRLDGICAVGLDFGQLLCAGGERDAGLKVLTRSRDGFQKLGRPDAAARVQALLDRIAQSPPQPPPDPHGAGP